MTTMILRSAFGACMGMAITQLYLEKKWYFGTLTLIGFVLHLLIVSRIV